MTRKEEQRGICEESARGLLRFLFPTDIYSLAVRRRLCGCRTWKTRKKKERRGGAPSVKKLIEPEQGIMKEVSPEKRQKKQRSRIEVAGAWRVGVLCRNKREKTSRQGRGPRSCAPSTTTTASFGPLGKNFAQKRIVSILVDMMHAYMSEAGNVSEGVFKPTFNVGSGRNNPVPLQIVRSWVFVLA